MKSLLPAAIPAPAGATIIPRTNATDTTQYIGGSPVGMCHGKLSANSGEHAFNFWISSKGTIVYIEPQRGEFIESLGEGATIDFVYI